MRLFEILTTVATGATLFWVSFAAGLRDTPAYVLPGICMALAVAAMTLEGFRWQMAPIYAAAVCLLFLIHPPARNFFNSRLTYVAAGWAAWLLAAGSSALLAGIIYPVFEFGPLTGRYPVGTLALHLTQQERLDPYARPAGQERELMVEIWYPAGETRGSSRARYRDGRNEGWEDTSLSQVQVRAWSDPPLSGARERFPVLLFSGPVNRFQNTYETEDLASHGYIVVAMDHPYDSDVVLLPGGRKARKRKFNTFLDFSSEETYRESVAGVESDLQVRVADAEFVIDQLASWNANPSSKFHRRLDLNAIGMFGHSVGGAVTAEVCRRDPRVKAGVNMDGWMFGEAGPKGVPKPFFFMADCTQRPSSGELEVQDGVARREARRTDLGYLEIDRSLVEYGGYFLQVPGLEHMNFSDIVLYSRVKSRTGAGTVNIRRAHQMVSEFTLAFFNKFLVGNSRVPLQEVAARYPEARFREVPFAGHLASREMPSPAVAQ